MEKPALCLNTNMYVAKDARGLRATRKTGAIFPQPEKHTQKYASFERGIYSEKRKG